MDLEKRIEELEKRVAELEERIQEQPNVEEISKNTSENTRIRMSKSHIPKNPFGD